jgi:DNA polymerase II large subunit
MMLVTVVITNLLNNNEVSIDVRNIDIAAQICANALANNSNVDCEIQQ